MAKAGGTLDRQSQLVDAAMEVIRDRGIVNMRIQDVARRAGVSTGTIHYHFTDIDRLIYDVHTWACERFFAKRMAAVTEETDARDQLVRMIRSGLPESADDAVVVAMYEIDLYGRAREDPAHSLLTQALFDRQVALYFSVLQLGTGQGHFALTAPALDVAQNLVALEDSYGMHIINGNRSTPVERCQELILGYARTVTGWAGPSE
ncbi:TetR/AcrR family transcriptional regulator [Leifsonia shinshuensis]|uniref:AcrR family transcriptional regulator n=1 Tax=Leifsonia shinshuensis TaxID=150026 RepID=A0A853D409_9MICO|nr:TetR/AcrR family transcriptional regulator [Leifsonia shinshuensis]NYJ25740.1 AcrR family transcriptional regulator [Leifsonia shinshuensis]